jgi:hypothetical protein
MAELFPFDVLRSYSGSYSGSFQGDGSRLSGIEGKSTGSLVTSASFFSPNITFIKGDKTTFNVDISKIVDGGTF